MSGEDTALTMTCSSASGLILIFRHSSNSSTMIQIYHIFITLTVNLLVRYLVLIEAIDLDTSKVLTESHGLGRQAAAIIFISSRWINILMECFLVEIRSMLLQVDLLSNLPLNSNLVLPVDYRAGITKVGVADRTAT
jgi:hypothetical protein